MPKETDWGFGKPATVGVVVDTTPGERTVLSEEEQASLLEEHERLHLRAEYIRLKRLRRSTLMIDYRAATTTGAARLYWQRAQRHVAVRVYQNAK